MNFRNLNRLNEIANILSGNLLPVTSQKMKTPTLLKIYSIFVWSVEIVYLFACILGIFYVSKEKALQDSTVNIVVSVEVILLTVYLHNRKNLLRGLIEKLNGVLTADNETLRNAVIKTVMPLQRSLKIYTIASLGSVVIWTAIPLVKILQKNQFFYEDYQVPLALSREPFSIGVFVLGDILEMLGAGYTIFKKTSLDIYMMHLILLMTAQYKYLKVKFAEILRNGCASIDPRCLRNCINNCTVCETVRQGRSIEVELELLLRHHTSICQLAFMLRKLLSVNIFVLYVNNVFRLCFLGCMVITSPLVAKCLIVMYTIGALTQLYVLCYCVQQLFEASIQLTDDAFYEKWFVYNKQLQRTFAMIFWANNLQCRLSRLQNINLTLPSFMSILNQAYSFCLLFLKMK